MENYHITHIEKTFDEFWQHADSKKTAIDPNTGDWYYKRTNMHVLARQYYYDGNSYIYLDNNFGILTLESDLEIARYIYSKNSLSYMDFRENIISFNVEGYETLNIQSDRIFTRLKYMVIGESTTYDIHADLVTFQIGDSAIFASYDSNEFIIMSNMFYNSRSQWERMKNDETSMMRMFDETIRFYGDSAAAAGTFTPTEHFRIGLNHIFAYNLKSGTSQANAGADAWEWWVDTTDSNVIKVGT